MKRTFLLLAFSISILCSATTQDYHAEILGDAKVLGKLDIVNPHDSTSMFVGLRAGLPYLIGTNYRNTMVGVESGNVNLIPILGGIYGQSNALFGYRSGNKLTKGDANTFLGTQSGEQNSEGTNNVFVGHKAGNTNQLGNYNTYLGATAGLSNQGSNNTFLGYNAGGDSDGSGSIFIGHRSGNNASKVNNSLYISNQAGDNPLIYGDFSGRSVGINYNGSNLGDALHIESQAGQNPLKVRVNGVTRFRVFENGGASVGENSTPAAEGLKVRNLRGDHQGPLFVDTGGNLTRNSGTQYEVIHPMDLREKNWRGVMSHDKYEIPPLQLLFQSLGIWNNSAFAPVKIPNRTKLKEVTIRFIDPTGQSGRVLFRLVKMHISDPTDVTNLIDFESDTQDDDLQSITFNNLDELVDNENYYYAISFFYGYAELFPLTDAVIYSTSNWISV